MKDTGGDPSTATVHTPSASSSELISVLRREVLPLGKKDPEFIRIVENIRSGDRHINITGPVDQQKAFLVAALAQETQRIPVVIVPDELRARSLRDDLCVFMGSEIPVFRQRDMQISPQISSSAGGETERISILSRLSRQEIPGLVMTAASLLQPLMPVEGFRDLCIRIEVGQQLVREDFIHRLLVAGYQRCHRVEEPGAFTVRGDIVDVFSPGEPRPFRISFFDEEVDEVKTFDPLTQRSVENMESISVGPTCELVVSAQEQKEWAPKLRALSDSLSAHMKSSGVHRDIREKMTELYYSDADKMEGGAILTGVDRWLSLLMPDRTTVLSYLAGGKYLIFCDETIQIRKRLDANQAEWMQRYTTLFEKGNAAPESMASSYTGVEIFRELDRFPGGLVTLATLPSSGNGFPSGHIRTIVGGASDSYRGHEDKLAKLIRDRSINRQQTLLMVGDGSRSEKLRHFMAENHSHATFIPVTLNSGFSYPAANLMIVGSKDIFGVDRTVRRKKRDGMRIDLFSDLVQGEPVVHEKHGIGRYDGMTTLENGGVKRDYLKISYAADDVLYISIDNLDQIQKYVGSEGRNPKLSRLGGQEWNRMKEKARSSIKKLAIDLVALYAKRQAEKGYPFEPDTIWQREFEEDFPYEETQDQLDAIVDIKKDMESDRIMDRLLCGDVGFGKTEVAFRAIFKCVMSGKQAVLLAPTTVLTQQHYENLVLRLVHFPVKVGLLSRFATPAGIKNTLKGLADGTIDVVVGTHRILSGDVRLKNPGLLVIDEEQRFGVEHKERIKSFKGNIDVLTLTATPIPRTLHMSLSGIRDISILEDAPMDRRAVMTYVMEFDEEMVREACLREISREGQIFYLFNDTKRIADKAAALEKTLPGARILYAHGQMSERQLEDIIERFVLREADILVCTTIIESGIDMPNVNTVIIENADRFGLSQLYQIRGRVGRSDRQAYAYVTYKKDKVLSEIAQKRLAAIRDFTELGSGMKVALKDLEVRGAGNLLGAEQHGQMDMIGYDLYCRMLEEEIKTIKGEEPVKHSPAIVELATDAYIPQDYIRTEEERMDVYRKLADISSEKSYYDVLDELQDRYGSPPAKVCLLAEVSLIRHLASGYGFAKVEFTADSALLYYRDGSKPDIAGLSTVLQHPDYKGKVFINAMRKPYLHLQGQPNKRGGLPEQTRRMLQILTAPAEISLAKAESV